jgi:hypothetical protein
MRRTLRREVLRVPTDDGGLDLFDLLYDRIEHLSAADAQALDEGDPKVIAHLESLVLFEGEHSETLRRQRYARHHAEVLVHRAIAIDTVDWSLAEGWPGLVSDLWRDPEHLRRLAEARAAGNVFLCLPGFLRREAAEALAKEASELTFERMETPWVQGDRLRLSADGALQAWTDLLRSKRTRSLFGGVLGRTLDVDLTGNVWRLNAGDRMPVHADGRRYQGTVSLGLSRGWTAAQGGAIAVGAPGEGRFEVNRRWLPHLGDLLLFAPNIDTWHAVEPVVHGTRYSVTSWWTCP